MNSKSIFFIFNLSVGGKTRSPMKVRFPRTKHAIIGFSEKIISKNSRFLFSQKLYNSFDFSS